MSLFVVGCCLLMIVVADGVCRCRVVRGVVGCVSLFVVGCRCCLMLVVVVVCCLLVLCVVKCWCWCCVLLRVVGIVCCGCWCLSLSVCYRCWRLFGLCRCWCLMVLFAACSVLFVVAPAALLFGVCVLFGVGAVRC